MFTETTCPLTHLIPELANARNWLPVILTLDKSTLRSKVPRRFVPQLEKRASAAIADLEHQAAVNYLSLGLHLHPLRMLDEVRRAGLFRGSKYDFRVTCLRRVLTALLTNAESLELQPEFISYFRSMRSLTEAAKGIFNLNEAVRRFIRRHQSVFLKTTVAVVDALFMTEHIPDISLSTDKWEHYPKEALAESASYLIHQFDNELGVKPNHFALLDEEALARGSYHRIIVDGCKIRAYLDAEILVDAFNFACRRTKRAVRIAPPNAEFEKSIRLGYIQQEQADIRDVFARHRAVRRGAPSIHQLANEFYDRFQKSIVQTLTKPIQRYAFVFPNTPEFTAFFRHDGLFVEEMGFLNDVMESELATWEEVRRFEIEDGVLLLDFVKVTRLLTFMRQIARRHLLPLLKTEPHMVYRSLVPVFDDRTLRTVLGCCLSADKIDPIVRLMSWEGGTAGLFDLQYRPLIRSSGRFLSPLNVASTTHWYRNLAYTEKRRVIQTIEEEAASRALADVLATACDLVKKTTEIDVDGERFEIDVLARFGSILFVFECKHPLLPCNVHELRTSYDHMKKGAATLTRVMKMLGREGRERELYRRLGWEVKEAKEIVTCIVSCNGMFPGLTIDGHPIRRWRELRNMIETGTVRMRRIDGDTAAAEGDDEEEDVQELTLWDGPAATPEFLRRYLRNDLLHKAVFSSMVDWERSYRLGKTKLTFSTFLLDPVAFGENMRQLAT